MRFEGPLYEGDSILRALPAAAPLPDEAAAREANPVELSQRSIATDKADVTMLDAFEIEARARTLRAEAIHGWVSTAWAKFVDWLESGRRRQEEAYLARSSDLADLEARLRRLERDGYIPHI